MKITEGKGKIIRAGLPNLRQALFFASNDPVCQAASELHITPETGTKPEKNNGAGQSGATAGGGAEANSGTGGNG